jgi:hypothetical protein
MTTKVASVHFALVRAERIYRGEAYELPAVEANAQPALLTVTDEIQRWEGPYSGSTGKGRSKHSTLIHGEDIARDIVNQWTTGGVHMGATCHPGIWVVREQIPLVNEKGASVRDADGRAQWRPATDAEQKSMWAEDLAEAKAADAAYAQALFDYANSRAQDPRLIPFIPKNCRLAAERYGLQAEWLRPNAGTQRACPFCQKFIPANAVKCPNCQEVVDQAQYSRMIAQAAKAPVQAKA